MNAFCQRPSRRALCHLLGGSATLAIGAATWLAVHSPCGSMSSSMHRG